MTNDEVQDLLVEMVLTYGMITGDRTKVEARYYWSQDHLEGKLYSVLVEFCRLHGLSA